MSVAAARSQVGERLRALRSSRNQMLVGAAIGTGMTAQAAERGGADLLLALSAGRFRSMGVPSIASMLALRPCNEFVLDFARAEILPRVAIPVFFGASAFDPALDIRALVARVAAAGFPGVVNFPTAALVDGQFRQFLEESGCGFAREIALLEAARKAGLATLGYVRTADEAARMARAGVDIVNVDLGWNTGGAQGVASDIGLDEAAAHADRLCRIVRRLAPGALCMVEGGPIVLPEQMDRVCRAARADGYIGGSTIDRVPLETAIELVTAAFKNVGALRQRIDHLERQLGSGFGLVGQSAAIQRVRALIEKVAPTDLPVLIAGEAGTGKNLVASAIHGAGARRASKPIVVSCAAERLEHDLFGYAAGAFPGAVKARIGWLELARGATLVLDDIADIAPGLQRRLLEALETRRFWKAGGGEVAGLDVRLIGLTRHDPDALERRLDRRFLHWLSAARIDLPPLRERPEDLAPLIEHFLDVIHRGIRTPARALDPAAYRALAAHEWSGNLRELRAVLEHAALAARGETIGIDDLPHLGAAAAASRARFASEREWILDALRRNRFRRGETARFLGLSRKTLYNKIALYGLPTGPLTRRGA